MSSSSRPPQGLRVFVVDDDPAMARLVAEIVRGLHHEPHVFGDAESALAEHLEDPAQLFLVDWVLPGMDGVELVRKVRSAKRGQDAVVLVMTGRDRPQDLALVLDAGATDYLAKPMSPELIRTRLLVAERVVADRVRRRRAEDERARTHEALRRSQRDFRQITENAPVGIFIQRGDELLYVNPKMTEITGRSLEQVQGKHSAHSVHPDDVHIYEQRREQWRREGKADSSELRIVREDGEIAWIEVLPGGEIDFGGEPASIGVVRDVTQAREMRAKLHLADRLASVGTLAAGVAHEVNNPLGYVAANLEVLAERLPEAMAGADTETREDLIAAVNEARDGTGRVQEIVKQLGRFAHVDEEGGASVADVRAALSSALRLTTNELRHRAKVVRDIEDVPPVAGHEGRLSQVFVNLLVNAAQALDPSRSRLNRVRVHAFSAAGRVFVSVEDNGPGIPPDVASRIFDPFFTTKDVGEGTGLGLSISHSLIRGMGGEIAVDSETGRGTRVTVSLQARPGGQQTECEGAPAERKKTGSGKVRGRVLVIDDEDLVGRSLKRALHPHEVITACAIADALALLRSQSFDVVLCDLMMPDGGGVDFYERLARDRPELLPRLSFMTGGAFVPEAREFLERVEAKTFTKPFDLAALRAHVMEQIQD